MEKKPMALASLIHRMEDLPARAGPLPRMTPANPQEQLEHYPEDWAIITQLVEFAFGLPDVIEGPTRIAPPGSRAMILHAGVASNEAAFLVGREFGHIHNPPIGSMHLTLPEPARTHALAKRWIVRHPFAVRGVGPAAAVFVFAPRDHTELEFAKLLIEISHAFATKN